MSAVLVLDALAAALLLAGSALALAASVGILRFTDVLSRMHAATKPQVLGIVLCLMGAAIRLREHPEVWLLLLAAGFQLITAPVSAHMIARVAARSPLPGRSRLFVDDMRPLAEDPGPTPP